MVPLITLNGIDQAISNLNYIHRNALKSKLVHFVRQSYQDEDSTESVEGVTSDELIKFLWDTGDDDESIKHKTKNLFCLKTSLNTDLKRLYHQGKNPEGIMIGPDNTFVMSEEAKDKILEKYGIDFKPEGDFSLDQMMDLLKMANDIISGSMLAQDPGTSDGLEKLDQLKSLLQYLSEKIDSAVSPSIPPVADSSDVQATTGESEKNEGQDKIAKSDGADEEDGIQAVAASETDTEQLAGTEQVDDSGKSETHGHLDEDKLTDEIEGDDTAQNNIVEEFESDGLDEDELIDEIEDDEMIPDEIVEEIETDALDQDAVVEEIDIDDTIWDEIEADSPEEEIVDTIEGDDAEPGQSLDAIGTGDLDQDAVVDAIEGDDAEPGQSLDKIGTGDLDQDEIADAIEGDGTKIEQITDEIETAGLDDNEVVDEIGSNDTVRDAFAEEIEADDLDQDEVVEEIDVDDTVLDEIVEEIETDSPEEEEIVDTIEGDDAEPGQSLDAIGTGDLDQDAVVDAIEGDDAEPGQSLDKIGTGDLDQDELADAIEGDDTKIEQITDEIETAGLDDNEVVDEIGSNDTVRDAFAEEIEADDLDQDEVVEEIDVDDTVLDEIVEEIETDSLDEEDIADAIEGDDTDIDEIVDEIEAGDADQDEMIEEIETDDTAIDEIVDEIEADDADQDEMIEEIESDGLDEVEAVEEIQAADDMGLPVDSLGQEYSEEASDKINKSRLLAEEFDGFLGAMDRYFNHYILIPEGTYTIGGSRTNNNQKPAKTVRLEPFYIGRFAITNGLFEIFVEKTGYKTYAEKIGYGTVYYGRFQKEKDPKTGLITSTWNAALHCDTVEGACWYQPSGPGSTLHNKRAHPVVQITIEDAMAFAAWTGKRLPTEEEWEAASRSAHGWIYPWGPEWQKDSCNTENSCIGDTTPVDRYVAHENDFGIADTMGNVLEWTWNNSQDISNKEPCARYHIAKGGSWISGNDIDLCRRFKLEPEYHSNILGFRCVAY